MPNISQLKENEIYLGDCLELMKHIPDKSIDCVITDPPYGLDKSSMQGAGKLKSRILNTSDTSWDVAPTKEYFDEIFRISKNQVIWGGNYFYLPPTRGIVVWDKQQPFKNFSQCEYCWTSYDTTAKLYKSDKSFDKVHPTQKPLDLIKFCVDVFTNENDLILDPFLGSGTTAIAAYDLKRRYIGIEKEQKYFDIAKKRIEEFKAQLRMF